jgi:hypothetical protein
MFELMKDEVDLTCIKLGLIINRFTACTHLLVF